MYLSNSAWLMRFALSRSSLVGVPPPSNRYVGLNMIVGLPWSTFVVEPPPPDPPDATSEMTEDLFDPAAFAMLLVLDTVSAIG